MSEQEIYTIIAIDDHPLFRKGVSDLIDMDDSLQLIGEAANGQDGLALVKQHNPDLVLLDINMKGMTGLNMKGMIGLETLEEIKKLDLDSRILMLRVSDNDEDVIHALRVGADGYLLKDMEPEDTLKCLNRAAQGQMVISDRLTQLLAQALRGEANVKKTPSEYDFTEREQEILGLIAKGMSNKLIARELEISDGTVKVHVKYLLKKMGLHSRVEAAVWALKNL